MAYRQFCFSLLSSLLALSVTASTASAQQSNQGFIYGRVVTESGTEYQGFLRWGTQEAFWDDLFHSTKEDLPFFDYLDDDQYDRLRSRGRRLRIFNWDFSIEGEVSESRQFIARFGDVASIEPRGSGEATVIMRNGNEYEVSGGADDVTSSIHVRDATLGEIDIRWDRIETIEFMPAPREADPGVWRLHGTVETREGDFQGYIQWDKEECINTDVLDGDTYDGDVSIEMGRIRSIERLSSRRSLVTLKDGRELRLDGSNDVNDENRGIMVEDERYGRVTIDWDSFDKVTFDDPGSSGRSYADFGVRGDLAGTVIDQDGERHTGRLVFDLDESEGWEMLNGDIDGIDFDIPFSLVASIEPMRGGRCLVVLTTGETLTLENSQDVGENNSGVLVFVNRDPLYIPWADVDRIEFSH